MSDKKKKHPIHKSSLHPKNRHRSRYDFTLLIKANPELTQFVATNIYGDESIDFFNPDAVKALNKAILIQYYGLDYWDIPKNYLCPPIPGRADYIHHIASFIGSRNLAKIPKGRKITCLDIGVGANCVYPIIGNYEYGWSFIGSDIDPTAIHSAQKIIDSNSRLKGNIEIRLQESKIHYFNGIIGHNEEIDLSICNPPFHISQAEAEKGTIRKLRNLKNENIRKPTLNFGGKSAIIVQ